MRLSELKYRAARGLPPEPRVVIAYKEVEAAYVAAMAQGYTGPHAPLRPRTAQTPPQEGQT